MRGAVDSFFVDSFLASSIYYTILYITTGKARCWFFLDLYIHLSMIAELSWVALINSIFQVNISHIYIFLI